MKISQSAWHYKFLCAMPGRVPTSLCPYVRKLLISMVFCGVAGSFLATVSSYLIAGLFSVILSFLPWFVVDEELWTLGVATLFAIALVPLMVAAAIFFEWRGQKRWEARLTGVEEKPLGLVRSYIKAMHDKVCPSLTFTR